MATWKQIRLWRMAQCLLTTGVLLAAHNGNFDNALILTGFSVSMILLTPFEEPNHDR